MSKRLTHGAVDEDQGQGGEKIACKNTESPALHEDPCTARGGNKGNLLLEGLLPNTANIARLCWRELELFYGLKRWAEVL